MNKIKVAVVGNDYSYAKFLNDYTLVDNYESADVVIFTGGSDVDPNIYHHKRLPSTYYDTSRDVYEMEIFNKLQKLNNIKLIIGICRGSQFLTVANGGFLVQDVSNHCKTHSLYVNPNIDGCVNFRFLSDDKVKAIVEPLDRHLYLNEIITDLDRIVSQDCVLSTFTSSTHHQMMFPYKMNRADYRVLGIASKSAHYLFGCDDPSNILENTIVSNGEPEIVLYNPHNNIKHTSLAIQGHPEIMDKDSVYVQTLNYMINNILNR